MSSKVRRTVSSLAFVDGYILLCSFYSKKALPLWTHYLSHCCCETMINWFTTKVSGQKQPKVCCAYHEKLFQQGLLFFSLQKNCIILDLCSQTFPIHMQLQFHFVWTPKVFSYCLCIFMYSCPEQTQKKNINHLLDKLYVNETSLGEQNLYLE